MPNYKKILAAVDFSPMAEQVANYAAELAQRYGAQLTLLHVVEYLPPLDMGYDPMGSSGWILDETELVESAKRSLQKLTDKLGIDSVEQSVEVGSPKDVITHTAEEQQMDLIVVGSHGRHGIARLLGSTANGVLHGAPCDVLAVRAKQ